MKKSFNSLQVGYKQKVELMQLIQVVRVSIPYRLATNTNDFVLSINDLKVSIPYRLATNSERVPSSSRLHGCFNSLQVGYKLENPVKEESVESSFQFLIGWLQTINDFYVSIYSLYSFNSLQVGYKLRKRKILQALRRWVSIPYRLATNQMKRKIDYKAKLGFNSLQVGYKHPYL